MNPPHLTIEEIFFAASERQDAAARAAYLDEACGSDTELRRRLEGLLAVEPKVDQFLESPAVSPMNGPGTVVGDENVGTVIGPYKLMEVIGEGGMGVVYMAEQTQPVRRKVALKIIKPGMDTKQVIARFEAERQALALMEHPNIAKVHDGGMTETGRSYFVMELFRGDTITDFCDREQLSIPQRLELFVLVCRAVQHAHQKGIIHRDLKPSNILVTVIDGTAVPKIIDFGVAKAVSGSLTERTLFTGVHQLVGTPLYMSPEQAERSRADVDTRSDIYSLGVLLYELLVGATPFDWDTLREPALDQVWRIIREQEPPRPRSRLSALGDSAIMVSANRQTSPRKLDQALRGELDWIVMKCLEKDRSRRYETANAIASDLTRYLSDQPVEACPPSKWYRFTKYARRNRAVLAMTSVVSLALIAGTAISAWQAIRATGAEKRMATALRVADDHRRRAERHLYATRLRFARQALDLGQLDRAREILLAQESEPDGFAAGEFAWNYVRAKAWDVLRPVGRVGEAGMYAVPSPDGRFLASFDLEGPIHLIDGATLQHLATLATPGRIEPPPDVHFSPDGDRLVAIDSDSVPGATRRTWIWEVPTGSLLLEFLPPPGRKTRWASLHPSGRFDTDTSALDGGPFRSDLWAMTSPGRAPRRIAKLSENYSWGETSADCRLLAKVEPDRIVVHDALNGTLKHSLGAGTRDGLDWRLAFSADAQTLAAISPRRVEFWDLPRGILAAKREFDDSIDLRSLRASPDGATLVILKPEGIIELWNRQTGVSRTIRTDTLTARHEFSVKFSPDGRKLAILSRVANQDWGPLKMWDVATTQLAATCTIDRVSLDYAVFTPDGKHLILTRTPVAQIWQFEPPAPEVLAGHADEAWAVAFSPDGSLLASGSDDTDEKQTIKLWNVATGGLIRGWNAGVGTVSGLAFDPRGQLLASSHLGTPGEIRLWDWNTGRQVATLPGHADSVRSVAFSPSGTTLASAGSDRSIRLWDVAARRCLRVLEGHAENVRQVAFSPDGSLLASASEDDTVRLWDAATGSLVRTFQGIANVAAVAFAPDGGNLAAADENGMVSVWDVESGEMVQRMGFEQDYFLTLTYSPDGRSLAAAGKTRTIGLWDPVTGEELLRLDGHKGQVNHLAFSPDGTILASCSHDGAVKLWRAARKE